MAKIPVFRLSGAFLSCRPSTRTLIHKRLSDHSQRHLYHIVCIFPCVNPAELNSKSRLKPRVCFSCFARMVCITVFIRPQTNRIQGHRIINSSEFPPSPLKYFPLVFHPFCQRQHSCFKSDYRPCNLL